MANALALGEGVGQRPGCHLLLARAFAKALRFGQGLGQGLGQPPGSSVNILGSPGNSWVLEAPVSSWDSGPEGLQGLKRFKVPLNAYQTLKGLKGHRALKF